MREPNQPSVDMPFHVVDDFLPTAAATMLRADIDEHFRNPHRQYAEKHQVWNYWFVPEHYAYFRTSPKNIFDEARFDQFMQRLTAWSTDTLGLSRVRCPYLSLYLPGCRQVVHNDAANGRFAFVYSLTANERATVGGETIIYKQDDERQGRMTQPSGAAHFYTKVSPRFNRLIVFDDRLPHAVERVDGAMDPAEARFVLHGHINEGGPIVRGALSEDDAAETILSACLAFASDAPARLQVLHGPCAVRFTVSASGEVKDLRFILDRVIPATKASGEWRALARRLLQLFAESRFPAADDETDIIVPMAFGAPPSWRDA